MMWSERHGDVLLVYWRGVVIYKKMLDQGRSYLFDGYGPVVRLGRGV